MAKVTITLRKSAKGKCPNQSTPSFFSFYKCDIIGRTYIRLLWVGIVIN